MTTATERRDAKLRSLTEMVAHFDPSNPVHRAHFLALSGEFGEMWAAMLVSQDAAQADRINRETHAGVGLTLTDPGAINTYVGWTKANRVVRHGEVAEFTVYDFEAKTKVGGRVIAMFRRDQTLPAYMQPE